MRLLIARCEVLYTGRLSERAAAAAQRFAELVGGWIDGSVGNSPFDYHVRLREAVARGLASFPSTSPH